MISNNDKWIKMSLSLANGVFNGILNVYNAAINLTKAAELFFLFRNEKLISADKKKYLRTGNCPTQ